MKTKIQLTPDVKTQREKFNIALFGSFHVARQSNVGEAQGVCVAEGEGRDPCGARVSPCTAFC